MLEVYSAGDMQNPDYECGIWVPVCKSAGGRRERSCEHHIWKLDERGDLK